MIELDYDLCMAVGQDAGDHNMRKNGRTVWDEEDQIVATDTTNELLNSVGVAMNDLQETINGLIDMVKDKGWTTDEAEALLSTYLNTESFVENLLLYAQK